MNTDTIIKPKSLETLLLAEKIAYARRHLIELFDCGLFRGFPKGYTYTMKYGITKGQKVNGGLGFLWQMLPPVREHRFLMNLDLKGKTVFDLGGYIGGITLFFAMAVGKQGKVITFEPNPENFNIMMDRIKLNNFNNVEVHQIAISNKKGRAIFAFHPSAPYRGSMEKSIIKKLLKKKGTKLIRVDVDSLDSQIATKNLVNPNLIKIDVEGSEMDVLLGMRKTIQKHRPKLIIELHGDIENSQKVLKFLLSKRYSIYHIELDMKITLSNLIKATKGNVVGSPCY